MTFDYLQASGRVAYLQKRLEEILDVLLEIDLTPEEWDDLDGYFDEIGEDVDHAADVLEELREAKENAEQYEE